MYNNNQPPMWGNQQPPQWGGQQQYPQQQPYQQPMQQAPVQQPPVSVNFGTGMNLFGGLMGKEVMAHKSELPVEAPKKSKIKKPKVDENGVVLVEKALEGTVDGLNVVDYADTYEDTNLLLRGTIGQIDQLSIDLKADLDEVRGSRAIRGKHKTITEINTAMSALLSTRLSAIKELNSSINKINDMNYKKAKDVMAINNTSDEQYVMDMYNAFVNNPYGGLAAVNSFAPSQQELTMGSGNYTGVNVGGGNMVPVNGGGSPAQGMMNPPRNLTPEQNFMLVETDPNIQMCVVYDKATGNKWFEVCNIQTGEAIPNMPKEDMMFMEDTTIDVKNNIARNSNLGKVYPLIILNNDRFEKF